MQVYTLPPVTLIPADDNGNPVPVTTAHTRVIIQRGFESVIVPVSEVLPAANVQNLNPDQLKREIIVRAWIAGTIGPGRPIDPRSNALRTEINSPQPRSAIYSQREQVFIGDIDEIAPGIVRVKYGPDENNTPSSFDVAMSEFESISAESPIESCRPFIAAQLYARHGQQNAGLGGGIKVKDATQLSQAIIDFVAAMPFPYVSF